jgi:endothelin-converting enzyme/putative endopeptidase
LAGVPSDQQPRLGVAVVDRQRPLRLQRPRAKRALNATSAFIGDAVGKAYVERYFPASARDKIRTMVANIKQAFAQRLQTLDWMAPATRAEALRKVESIEVGVGYPDAWRNYSTLTVTPDNAYANVVAAQKFEYAYQLSKIGHPLDRKEWWMTAQTVNAVNLPVQNALNFPAGILQPPYFNQDADDAANYGATGATIGHEISHSFDNNGAAFDSTGALRNWWTPADLAAFTRQGQALARQYDAYEPLPGLHIKGELTLGENIADLAGLQAAYNAYRASLNGREAPVIDGLTGDQRFFLAYAQSWKKKIREAALRQEIATDGHAPDQWRVYTVRNLDAWYEAFNVEPGDALYLAPEARVRVW